MTASVKPLPELKKRLLTANQLSQPKNVTGAQGEQRALTFLLSQNYQLLDRNVRLGRGEIDLVMIDVSFDEVVFVEVKTRSSDEFGDPSLAVNYRKLKAMRTAAGAYLQACQLEKAFRFDIISVLPRKIEHFANITW